MMAMNGLTSEFSIGTTLALLLFKYAGAVDRIDDPEPEVTWTPPAKESDFVDFKTGANYTGLLYAGAAEFNWIVDIRTTDMDQEYWSVGNLVSFYHVLTTARAVDLLEIKSNDDNDKVKESEFPDSRWSAQLYRRFPSEIRINYCKIYLWEEGSFTRQDIARLTSGSRSIKRIIRHPDYQPSTLSYDVAIMTMISPIPSAEPHIGYMPTGYDYVNEKTKEMIRLDPSAPISYMSPLCYVASYGKNPVNNEEFYVRDYKVKFRVYITKWSDCKDVWNYTCNDDADRPCRDKTVPEQGRDYLMCMRPRAKVGTVCDHDRGAPVVCNGQAIALVVRGPKFKHCNNLYKIPFVAERLDHYREFFDDTVRYVVKPVPRKEDTNTQPPQTVAPYANASAPDVMALLYVGSLAFLSATSDRTIRPPFLF